MSQSLDDILDEMGVEIRALREEIMVQNILQYGYKRHIKNIEKENDKLKLILKRAMQ